MSDQPQDPDQMPDDPNAPEGDDPNAPVVPTEPNEAPGQGLPPGVPAEGTDQPDQNTGE